GLLLPVRSCPDTGRFLAALKKLELVVAIDIQMSDTAYHAHYILPESAYLERSDPFEVAGPTIALRQPVVKALGDTKGEDDIISELARAVGTGEYFNYSLEEYNDTLLAPLGISHRQLMQEGVIKVETQAPNYDKLPTPSGKVELASETMKKAGASPVPVWEPPLVEPDKSNFRLLHGHVAMHTHTSTQNNGWLHGLMPENDLWIHPMRAKDLGIKNGDLVEVESGVGKVTIKARVTEGIQPEAVFMAHGFGSTVPNQHLAYKRGANHSQLVPIITASLSGAAAQCEVLVKVRKVG
ncbi:MAG: molybdopterin-dependent oxidoreductase, partial [Firmicutes bacterium]|nr:molybdopterin-dependent oxidoreductase [Bacillota bacterium]